MDTAQQLGYLQGMQESTQREVARLAGEQATTSKEVSETKGMVFSMKGEVEGLRTDVRELTSTLRGSGTQKQLREESVVVTILKSPITPVVIVALAMALTIVLVFSYVSNRPANSFMPITVNPAPAPVPSE